MAPCRALPASSSRGRLCQHAQVQRHKTHATTAAAAAAAAAAGRHLGGHLEGAVPHNLHHPAPRRAQAVAQCRAHRPADGGVAGLDLKGAAPRQMQLGGIEPGVSRIHKHRVVGAQQALQRRGGRRTRRRRRRQWVGREGSSSAVARISGGHSTGVPTLLQHAAAMPFASSNTRCSASAPAVCPPAPTTPPPNPQPACRCL